MRSTGAEMPLLGHLIELRRRIILSLLGLAAGSVAGYFLYPWLSVVLYTPFQSVEPLADTGRVMVVGSLAEGFLTRLKISLLAGLVISSPVHVYSLLAFVFPGLDRRERRIVAATMVSGALLAAAAFLYGFLVAVPMAVTFLTSRRFIPAPVGVLLGYGPTIMFVLQFLLATILVFELPIALILLLAMNVLNLRRVVRSTRYVIVVIFIVAAVLTPPDVVSQLLVAGPLLALYLLALLAARLFRLGRREE